MRTRDNTQCRNLAEQLRDCLSGKGCGLKSIDIMFPVRPVARLISCLPVGNMIEMLVLGVAHS